MNFKNIKFKIISLAVCLIPIVGCNQFIKGKPKEQATLELNTQDLNCVKNLKVAFKNIKDGLANESEIDQTATCLAQAIDQIKEKVEGRTHASEFTINDLSAILKKFFPDVALDIQAVKQILSLKKALLGGSDQSFTKVELDSLKKLILLIKIELKKIMPYMQVLTFKKEFGPYDPQTVKMAFSQVKLSLNTIIDETEWVKSGYTFKNFEALIQSLFPILKVDQNEINEQFKLIESSLSFLLGDDPLVTELDYKKALDNLIIFAELYATSVLTNLRFEINNKEQLSLTINFVEQLILSLEKTVQYEKHKIIAVDTIDPIIAGILKSGVLPLVIKKETFLRFYKTIMMRICIDYRNLSAENFEGLKEVHFKNLKREFYVFKLYLDFINQVTFGAKNTITADTLKNQLESYNFAEAVEKISDNLGQEQVLKDEILRGLMEYKSEASSKFSVVYRNKKMVLANNQNKAELKWDDLARAHYGKSLGRGMMIGWGELDPQYDLSKSYLLEKGFVKWYADFREFGVEIKLFDKFTVNAGAENFTKADLFTTSGNGDNTVSYPEILQFVNMILSAGGGLTSYILQDMMAQGCGLDELDVYDSPLLDEQCFIKRFKEKTKDYFSHIYNFSAYVSSLNNDQFLEFYKDLKVIAYDKAISKENKIGTAEIRAMALTTMFVESLFAVYDQKTPFGTMDREELTISYSRFKPLIQAKAESKGILKKWDVVYNPCSHTHSHEELFQQSFLFLAQNSHLPEDSDLRFIRCITGDIFDVSGTADRKSVINTLKFLKSDAESSDASKTQQD